MSFMLSRMKKVAAATITCVALSALGACGGSASSGGQSPQEPIAVTSSINQWGLLAKQIGGDQVKVTSILGSTNVDAHDFEPQTSDIATISKSRILVVNGAGYDEWAVKASAGTVTTVSAADAVGAADGDNPHLWFSKDARKAMARELAEAFAKERPAEKDYFDGRLQTWSKSESELETTMDTFAERHPKATYAATESVAYYLMSDLNLTDATPQAYAQAVANESEPAPADVQKFQSLITAGKISVLVNNTQEASDMTNLITGTAHKSSVPVLDVSEQVPEGQDSLVSWMNSLISACEKALDESAPEK
ncbi:ABC transporter substrate-binding protein [Bifidobacterium margollesii]|uniref:ABC transporter substrate-binding protein n=1 Tax=Bifidobacterium margollesii TaxID=2020964 RepID=A0A2N5J983_9BIFI|nr:zinc ABC transporter substrate-binding protein [Bifidobacterium margollesii]PLS30769.1 ABC transporter substrate-binding protein [Bifidobacterium margollesii]